MHLIDTFIILPELRNTLHTYFDLTTSYKSFTSLKEVTLRHFLQHLSGIFILSVVVIYIAFAGGYQLNEQGARAVGMGGAFVARASDPSAIYYNPAGLAFQKGTNILLGTNIITPSMKFKGVGIMDTLGGEASTKTILLIPVNLYGINSNQ